MFFDLDKDDETIQPMVYLIGEEDCLFDNVLFIDRVNKSMIMTLYGS